MKFSNNLNIPDYLEETLSPFAWSGVFSQEFKLSIVNMILNQSGRQEDVEEFKEMLDCLSFLDHDFKVKLVNSFNLFYFERRNGYHFNDKGKWVKPDEEK